MYRLAQQMLHDVGLDAEGIEASIRERLAAMSDEETEPFTIAAVPTEFACSWFDPRTGIRKPADIYDNTGDKVFDVPGMSDELSWLKNGRGCDWVLIIESV